jgi:hypothetical protein
MYRSRESAPASARFGSAEPIAPIYIISHGALEFVSVEEVHKHDY